MINRFFRCYKSFINFIYGYFVFISAKSKKLIKIKPVLNDFNLSAKFDPHYLYQGTWIAEKLNQTKPMKHYDFGSDIRLISSLCHHHKIIFNDIFLPNLSIDELTEVKNDLYNLSYADNTLESISCLHVLEHVGLGRYGDQLNLDGHILAIKELKRVLRNNGNLFISTPVGKSCIYFNAHRVFSYDEFLELFNDMEMVSFEYLPDDSKRIEKNYLKSEISNNYYGCGFFWFRK